MKPLSKGERVLAISIGAAVTWPLTLIGTVMLFPAENGAGPIYLVAESMWTWITAVVLVTPVARAALRKWWR